MSSGNIDVSSGETIQSPLRCKNGDVVVETTGYHILDLFNKLKRGLDNEDLKLQMDIIFKTNNINDLIDLFVLLFQTRDCHNGKGERQLFLEMFKILYTRYPYTCIKLLPFIPMFGYVKDLISIFKDSIDFQYEYRKDLQKAIFELLSDQLIEDYEKLLADKENAKISLTAKWIPKEGCSFAKKYNSFFLKLVNLVFLKSKKKNFDLKGHDLKCYRLLVTSLNKHLDTLEIKMCSSKYSEIDFSKVPSIALNKWRKALLNEKINKAPTKENFLTGNRYPNRQDRVDARANLRSTVREYKIKDEKVFPHTIINSYKHIYLNYGAFVGGPTESEKEVLEDQWNNFVMNSDFNGSRKIIPMANISELMLFGSGDIRPMTLSIGLSILFSQVTHSTFKDRVLTYESNPKWVNLSEYSTLESKIRELVSSNTNSCNTNIQVALELILNLAISTNVISEDIPDLCIFTNMKIDSRVEYSETWNVSIYETMKAKFVDAGFEMPRIIFWNLSAKNTYHYVSGNIPNTVILSGFSQSIFKYIMNEKEITPYDILRDILDSERYKCIKDFTSSVFDHIMLETDEIENSSCKN